MGRHLDIRHHIIRLPPAQELDLVEVDTTKEEVNCVTRVHGASAGVFEAESQVGADGVGVKMEAIGDLSAINLASFVALYDVSQGNARCHPVSQKYEDKGSGG